MIAKSNVVLLSAHGAALALTAARPCGGSSHAGPTGLRPPPRALAPAPLPPLAGARRNGRTAAGTSPAPRRRVIALPTVNELGRHGALGAGATTQSAAEWYAPLVVVRERPYNRLGGRSG